MQLPEIIDQLYRKLETGPSRFRFQAFAGFDGFVDKIQKAVKSKRDQETVFFQSIQEFSQHLNDLGGRSGQVEIITSKTKFGGNAPILSNTFLTLGVKSICFGSLGYPTVHPVFNAMNQGIEKISVADPGESQALEFGDGKIILSELSSFNRYNWNAIKDRVNVADLRLKINECDLVALVDWANIPSATSIWEGFLNDVIRPLGKNDTLFFFDLCDPSKKPRQEIEEILDLITHYSNCGKVTLGVNENEAVKIWLALNGKDFHVADGRLPSLKQIGLFIFERMNIENLLIHPIDRTLIFQNEGTIELNGRLITEPKVLTGGGDNLNAGYCLGWLLGLEKAQCMVLGMAASGAYIQNGASPNLNGLISYLKVWESELKTNLESINHIL